jgi:hypothetical protein
MVLRSNATTSSHLPPYWNTLYKITRFDETLDLPVEEFLESGVPVEKMDARRTVKLYNERAADHL